MVLLSSLKENFYFDIRNDLSTWACRHNRNCSECLLSEMFTGTGLWLCFDLCCVRICFWIDGFSTFYFWQGDILVIIKISIRLEITLRLAGPDVFFLPQTCLPCPVVIMSSKTFSQLWIKEMIIHCGNNKHIWQTF